MTTVQDLVTGAYLRSTTFDPGKLALDAELIAHLNRVYLRVWPLIARARPDQYGAEATVAMTGAPASGALPANVIDVLQAFDADGDQVYVIPATDRKRTWNLAPSVFRVGTTLQSRAQSRDPVGGDTLTLSILDQPTAL